MPVHDAVERIREISLNKQPWVIVGKGPTAARVLCCDPDHHNILTLNHACTLVRPVFAVFMDIEAYKDCEADLQRTAQLWPKVNVCLPWYPHLQMKPNRRTCKHYATNTHLHGFPVGASLRTNLGWFWSRDLLVSYNSTTAGDLPKNKELKTIRVRYFSAVAAFNLLAAAGVKNVLTAGVDGGSRYSILFNKKDRLANGRSSFDIQFQEIDRTCAHNHMTRTMLQ